MPCINALLPPQTHKHATNQCKHGAQCSVLLYFYILFCKAEGHSECKEGRKIKSNLPPGSTIFDLDGRTGVDAFGVLLLPIVATVRGNDVEGVDGTAHKHSRERCTAQT